jgi:hypothetical protein
MEETNGKMMSESEDEDQQRNKTESKAGETTTSETIMRQQRLDRA